MQIINLKNNISYLSEYINLRNRYSRHLLSDKITYEPTKEWLNFKDVSIFLALQEKEIIGVSILYHHRNNEIAIFTKYQGKGIGTKLLDYIIKRAKSKNYNLLWAWIEQNNILSHSLFKKFGFIRTKNSIKKYNGIEINGQVLEKRFRRRHEN